MHQNGDRQVIDDRLLATLTAANAAWPESARKQMMDMVEQIARSNKNIGDRLANNQGIDFKKGFIAEEIHAETHNLDAILQNKTGRAITGEYSEEWKNLAMRGNDPVSDIAVVKDGKIVHKAQSKYYKNAEQTANELRRIDKNTEKIKYQDVDSMIAPSDQINPTDGKRSVTEEARRTRLKNIENRPQVAEAAKNVEEKTRATLKTESGKSMPLTEAEAKAVAKDGAKGRKIRKAYQGKYKTASTLQQMKGAAVSAAAISAIISGTLNTVQYLRLVREKKITPEGAVQGIVKNTAASAGDSALKAAAAAGAISTVTRISAGTVAQQAFNGIAGTALVAGGAICAVDAIQCMVAVAAGKMTPADLENRLGKNVLQLGVAGLGSHIGLGVASSLGVTAGFAPLAAGLAGAMIAGTAITIAIENNIEKPYREAINNNLNLAIAGYVMTNTAEAMSYGQKGFASLIELDAAIDAATNEQLNKVDQAGDEMWNAIDRL